jgi:hypothetical protein
MKKKVGKMQIAVGNQEKEVGEMKEKVGKLQLAVGGCIATCILPIANLN